MADLFDAPPTYPEAVLLSIYNQYPRKDGRPAALKRINEALDRICQGEIDGAPRTQIEAIEFLRLKVEEARRLMGARQKKFIPLMATWLNGRRYLRPELAQVVERPKRMVECVMILSAYPTMPVAKAIMENIEVFLPALAAVDKALERKEDEMPHVWPEKIVCRLRGRTELYAMAVKQWPVEDLKYVPNPVKWFSEARYEQPESSWQRKPANGFEQERQQLRNITLQ
jgi:hypothetical protein